MRFLTWKSVPRRRSLRYPRRRSLGWGQILGNRPAFRGGCFLVAADKPAEYLHRLPNRVSRGAASSQPRLRGLLNRKTLTLRGFASWNCHRASEATVPQQRACLIDFHMHRHMCHEKLGTVPCGYLFKSPVLRCQPISVKPNVCLTIAFGS